ncbi:MAG TPA: gliding motility-associated protein GldE [Cyclobacteriaceae bacterium]
MDSNIDDPHLGIAILLSSFEILPFFIVIAFTLIVLLIFSGLVSGSEVAFFSLTHDQLKKCKSENHSSNTYIISLLGKPQRLLATILILNNFINVTIITISTYATWQLTGTKDTEGPVLAALSLSITILIILFGEIVPKIYANNNNLYFARFTARILMVSSYAFKPLSWMLMSMTKMIEKRIKRKGYEVSIEELNKALELTTHEEASDEEKEILKGIVNFGTLSVKQVMKSRMDITAFDSEIDFHELMDQVNKTGYSRIPVYRETIDKIEGILYVKDLLPYLNEDENFNWQKLLNTGFFIPESKKIDSLFKDFQQRRVHMAIVVDEYGGTSGLVTMEDIVEEIVGEIKDEFDEEKEIAYTKLDKNTYVFDGRTSLNDFCKIVGVENSEFDEVKGDSESLGGLLLEINQKIPNAGEKTNYGRFLFTTVAVDNKRIKRVRVYKKQKISENNYLAS